MSRTLLIGLDGATFTALNPLMDAGVMPFLRSFIESGASAPLRTIVPALTPPAWTSLMTGRTPGHHGVFDFFRLESNDSKNIRFFTSKDVRTPTIWSLAADQDKRVTCLNFPSMFPPPRIPGFIVPGWVPWRQLRLACWPPELFDRLKSDPAFNARELAMDMKLEERATEGCADLAEIGPWIEFHIRREENWYSIFRTLTAESPSDLTAVLFDGVDKLQHLCWRFIFPEDGPPLETEVELKIRELCLAYFNKLDSLLEKMCAEIGEEATVVLASDHGFGPTHEVFHVNTWLERNGYLGWSEKARSWNTEGAVLGVGQVAKHTWLLDWDRTRAFAATPTSNGLFLADRNMSDSKRAALLEEIKSGLLRVTDSAGERVVAEAWTREEAFGGPAGKLAPDLTLVMRDGGLVSILPSEEVVAKRDVIAGAHRPVGVFAARGPGIRRGATLGELSILDIAPLALYSLGLPIPENMEGAVPTDELYESEALARRPAVRGAAAVSVDAIDVQDEPSMDAEDEQQVLEQMRALGYLE